MRKLLFALLAAVPWMAGNSFGQIIVGAGPDSSFVVIEATAYGAPIQYEYRYDYAVDGPFDTSTMLLAIDAAIPEISFTLVYGNAFLDSITYNSNTLVNATEYPYSPFWAQWVSGGESGNPLVSMPSGVWSEGNGLKDRKVQPNSWDGFIFNGVYNFDPFYVLSPPPSVAPIPEPSAAGILAMSGACWMLLRRRTRTS